MFLNIVKRQTIVAGDVTNGLNLLYTHELDWIYTNGQSIPVKTVKTNPKARLIAVGVWMSDSSGNYIRGHLPEVTVMNNPTAQGFELPMKPAIYGHDSKWIGNVPIPAGVAVSYPPGSVVSTYILGISLAVEL